jgi:uncharacterized membrane protein
MTAPDLHGQHHDSGRQLAALTLGLGAVALGLTLGAASKRNRGDRHPPDMAPGYTARRSHFGDYAVVGRSVTINKPRQELYDFWRDFSNLPNFMDNIEAVTRSGDKRTVWTIRAPGWQTVEVETEVVEDVPGALIAWRSTDKSQIDTEGRVSFRDAGDGRGTMVEAIIAYKPPAGDLGRLVAKLFGREPNIQGRHELKRFKMLMETGEIATSENHHQPA